jgi:flagellar hook-associated protein 2
MPTLQSPGVGSGLDVNGLVTQLVAAEKAPGANRIARETTSIGTEISALGTLKGVLSSFNTTLAPLKTVEAFSARSAASGDEEVFTAKATAGSAPSSYDVTVSNLASAHQLASTAFVGGSDSTIGSGTLTISLGTATFDVAIDSTATKLSDIRDAINRSPSNLGVRASIVSATDGAHLVLTSSKTGAANTIKVTTTATDGLQQLTYDSPSDVSHYTRVAQALDSTIVIAGFTHHSASNVVSDAIDGVTLTLLKEQPLTPVSLTVAADTAAASTRIKNFVSQYNAAMNQLRDLGKYDATTGKSGPLIGDALLRSVTADMRRGAGDAVVGTSGNINALAQVGITTAKDGSLQLDESKLNAALATNFDAVGALFGSDKGVAARMSAAITLRLDGKAEIASRNAGLDKRSKSVAQRQKDLDLYLAKVESNYRAQFTALDVAMAKMQSTSSYLSQQLASLAKL